MKDYGHPVPCGCGRPSPRPPEPPGCSPCSRPLVSGCGGGFLMQRILASGSVHRRRVCYPVSLSSLPEEAKPPFTVLEADACAMPCWEEMPSRDRRGLCLLVTVPVTLRVRDRCGCLFCVSTEIQEELRLRCLCPPNECWRGQPLVQAAVRLSGRPCPFDSLRGEIPLEICLDGYLIAPCALNRPEPGGCARPLPWYPEPIYDPYNP